MRIALFHNLGAGGAKRHLYEQARALRERGHRLDLFIPAEANEDFLPLAGVCENVRVFGVRPHPPSPSPVPGEGESKRIPPLPLAEAARNIRLPLSRNGGGGRGVGANPRFLPRPLLDTLWTARQTRRLAALTRTYAQIAAAIDAGAYDVLYVHHCRQQLAPDLLRLVRRTPTVFCCHDTPRATVEWPAESEPGYDSTPASPFRRKRMGRWLSPPMLAFTERENRRFEANIRAAGRVLANSFYSRECLARVAGVDARVCYPGVDADFFHSASGRVRERTVLSVGSLLPSKRHDFVIRAVGQMPSATRPPVLLIGYESGVGTEGARLTALAGELGVALTIRREVSDGILREAYQSAGVVAFAPYLEPFGLVALEAAACGTPVVGVREGGVRETVVEGETGFLTDRDPTAFADALAQILDHPTLARRLGERGRARVVADWTWERSAATAEIFLRRATLPTGSSG